MASFISPDPPTVSILSHSLSELSDGTVNVNMAWTLSDGDSADFYLINITTNAPQTPYGGLLNITTASVTEYELTGFISGYDYNITVCGVNCGSQEGRESEPLRIRPQGMYVIVIPWLRGLYRFYYPSPRARVIKPVQPEEAMV